MAKSGPAANQYVLGPADMDQDAAYASCPELIENLTIAKDSLLQLIESENKIAK